MAPPERFANENLFVTAATFHVFKGIRSIPRRLSRLRQYSDVSKPRRTEQVHSTCSTLLFARATGVRFIYTASAHR